MPSRLILRGGDELFVAMPPAEVVELLERLARESLTWTPSGVAPRDPGVIAAVPLVPWSGTLPRSGWVRVCSIDAVEPLDERELAAHARDREEWMEHGVG